MKRGAASFSFILTVDGELPVVLDGGVGDLGVLRPAGQSPSVVRGSRLELQGRDGHVSIVHDLRKINDLNDVWKKYER